MNAVNDLLKKYIDLILAQKNYLESGKRDPKRYYIVIDELIALIASTEINSIRYVGEQQLETIAVIGALRTSP